MRKNFRAHRLGAGLAASFLAITASAASFTPGNVVVYRVGSGGPALVSTGSPVFLDEFDPAVLLAPPVQTIALPTAASGANRPFAASGTAATDGLLTRSVDGTCLAVPGYGRDPAFAGNNLVSAAGVPRVVARVTAAGAVDTSTALTDSPSAAGASNFRSAASVDCGAFWTTSSTAGIHYAAFGATTSTDLGSAAYPNVRAISIFAGQLYADTSVASPTLLRNVAAVGGGLPTSGAQTLTRLPGLTDAGANSPFAFFLADLDAGVAGVDTLYVADETAGLLKYALVGGNWVARGVIGPGTDAYRGLAAEVNGGSVTLYATRKGGAGAAGGGELVKLVDASGYNGTLAGTPTVIAAAGANTAFRGVALAPAITITPTAGAHGTIAPSTPQAVAAGATKEFTVTPEAGYSAVVNGCGGTLAGNTFTTGPATVNCTVSAVFTQIPTYVVTPHAGAHGRIDPSTAVTLPSGEAASFVVTPDPGYAFDVTSTCGGSLSGNTWTIAPAAADCSVDATFTLITRNVTPVPAANGTIAPDSVQVVALGSSASFTITPSAGYRATVGGSCGGTLSGASYVTNAVNVDCTVEPVFTPLPRYTVTPSAGAHGTIAPNAPQSVVSGETASFTITPAPGYSTAVRGTCGGSLSGGTFTTNTVTQDCSVMVTFSHKLVLFVGNSYTFGRVDPVMSYNTANVTDLTHLMWLANPTGSNDDEPHPWGGIPGVFKKLTDQAGLDYDVSISARNAASLRGHYLNSNPAGWDLRGNIASQRWDTVVLQDLSDEPLPAGRGANANLPYFNAYVDEIVDWVHGGAAQTYTETQLFGAGNAATCAAVTGASIGACNTVRTIAPANANANPGADIILYQTWARPDMIGPNGTNASGTFYTAAEGLEKMTADFHDAYFGRAAANAGIADVSPVGDAFLRAVQDGVAMRDPYVPEAGKINLWHTDFFHPSKYGSYLSALVHFARITGLDPMAFGPGEQAAADLGIAPAVAVQLQRVARETVMPDNTAPTTVATQSPPPNANGWNRTPVVVTFNASDASGWGVSSITYALSGAQSGGGTLAPGGSITIASDGVTTITYYATDAAGNAESPRTLRVSIDRTGPVISGMPPFTCGIWPPNHKMVVVAMVSASSTGAALASFDVTATSSEPAAPGESDTLVTGSGLGPRTVSLRADRAAYGNGRTYTIRANATDAAGNTAAASATCVVPHDRGK